MASDKAKGIVLAAIAAATYGMNPLFALPLYAEGMDTYSVLFYRYLFAVPMLAVMIKARGRDFKLQRKEIIPIIIAGLIFAMSSITLFLSYRYMAAGIASTILFIYPVLVAVIMAVFFKEKVRLATVVSILLSLIGIALLYKGDDGTTLNLTGVLIVAASALLYAVYIVGVNQSRILRKVPTVKLTFYGLVTGTMLFFCLTGFGTGISPVKEWYHWFNLIALAALPTAVSLTCTTTATHYIGATPTAILGALEPVTAVIIGAAVFNESLTDRIIFGILLIILAVMLIVTGDRIPAVLLRFRKLFPKLKKQ